MKQCSINLHDNMRILFNPQQLRQRIQGNWNDMGHIYMSGSQEFLKIITDSPETLLILSGHNQKMS